MAASPDFKIYRDGVYVASVKYLEDAAALVANGGSVRYQHSRVIWQDTKENASIAANSYDEAADIMRENLRETIRRPLT